MAIFTYSEDLPLDFNPGLSIAIDTETMGLNPFRDRLCVVQISTGNGDAALVHFKPQSLYNAPHLKKILSNPQILKIFHYGRFDIMMLKKYLNVQIENVFCTKIASRLCRTYTDRHGLKNICHELLGIELSKQEQTSDWGSDSLTESQMQYAASDVLYLHQLMQVLTQKLKRESRIELAQKCFEFLPFRAELDLLNMENTDIFAHS